MALVSNIVREIEQQGVRGNVVDQGLYGSDILVSSSVVPLETLSDSPLGQPLIMSEIPVNAKVLSLAVSTDYAGSDDTLGLLRVYAGNLTVDEITDGSEIADLTSLQSFEIGFAGIDNEFRFDLYRLNTAQQKLWEVVGLPSEPGYSNFYVSCDVGVPFTAPPITGTFKLNIEYTL